MKIVRFEERLIDNNLHRFAIYEDGSEEEILAPETMKDVKSIKYNFGRPSRIPYRPISNGYDEAIGNGDRD